ncbi:MAG: trypsin-like peptidase domain-containing protein [Candidatus Portnoybacteria bacterium]|nr:trypsin-like peptidase domain-containing protein [Candidatus Portnoybacteria bacterium]
MLDQKDKEYIFRMAAITVLICIAAGFFGGMLTLSLVGKVDIKDILTGKSAQPQGEQLTVTSQNEAVIDVVKNVSPAVVSIIATKDLPYIENSRGDIFDFFNDPFNFFSPFRQQTPKNEQKGETQKQEVGGGTGFIISSDGLILTNKHVVSIDGAEYTVLTNDGKKYSAKVLALDPNQDIAILKVEHNNLPTVKLGDSENLHIGQSVVTIGNALGEFRNTVSVGVVSGLRRSISASSGFGSQAEELENVIQTDAAINPGNSGGPLLNLAGEVIGINVAIAQSAENIAFALPINLAKKDIEQVEALGKISTPFLGIRYILITPLIKDKNGLSVDYGAFITRGENPTDLAVVPGSGADKAGLKESDIILEAEGQKIDNDNPLNKIIQKYKVGDTLNMKILRDGKEQEIRVTLGEK